ncbi:tRNA 2-selenouridine(34) synthase MnmH [Synechococcus sp. M16CYN]|uniref:tRNA 2-selenouridine(34) synthase MnmH n=1 Tax=Synechococcus sp. M16CYN TaxID=3103139 RepID=UPI00324AB9D2
MSGMEDDCPIAIDELRNLHGPLVDVRSPAEFLKGHWPGATNLPLFNDEERVAVGTSYKQDGRIQAIHLGLRLAGPKMSALANKLEQFRGLDRPRIYCWRGGMRSVSMAWLAEQIDLKPLLLQGGYKAYRHWAQSRFDQPWPLRIIGGQTGTGKTDLLLALNQKGVAVLNLEGLANHRGSSFGGLGLPDQPSTEHYENLLAEVLDGYRQSNVRSIWLEAESIQVGRCRIPKSLFNQMRSAPVIEIRRSLPERVKQLVEVYGHQSAKALADATHRISRRLGPQRTEQALGAIAQQDWTKACRVLLDYYDRCYDHALSHFSKPDSVDLTGQTATEAADWLIGNKIVEISS